jgi:hypothetical protein
VTAPKRYRVELWTVEGEPDRMPDAIIEVHAKGSILAERRAVEAAMWRAERAAGMQQRGERADWGDYAVMEAK